MASFFGEINELSSRAVDDEEIDDQPTYNLTLDHKSKPEKRTDSKLLVIAAGDLATAFSKCYLISDSSMHLFDVEYSSSRTDSESNMYTGGLVPPSKGLKAASVYSVNEDIVVCEVPNLVPEEIAMDVCSMVLSQVYCLEGLCLTSKHMANFKSAESVQSSAPFIKTLATSKYHDSHSNAMSRLQAPNFVSGFPAAFLAEFQVKNKAALCIVNYVDSDLLDSSNVQIFERVRDVDLSIKVDFVADAKAKLAKYIKSRHSIESNLYT